ncbi:MAG: threonine/serine exporter family protein [Clostridia bacterium]|nr:threonine/serine exporter family protein [Clostridia bacterium]
MAEVIPALKGLAGSFGACLCFALLFHIPKRCLLSASFTGMAGYGVYMACLALWHSAIGANFIGALAVAVLAEILARRQEAPAVIFSLMGIVPLVPGAGLYRTMLSLVLEDYPDAASIGVETMLVAASIALAVATVTVLVSAVQRHKNAN